MGAKDEDDDAPPGVPASEHVTIEELEALMAAAVDEDGNDIRLAEATARMTPEERRKSEENIRAWAEHARKTLRRKRAPSDEL